MKPSPDLKKFVEYGIKAPSGHNTQPWKFVIKDNKIEIHPDFDRKLPIVDGDNHALYMSLGCAVENIILAAKNDDYEAELKIIKDLKDIDFISITMIHNNVIQKDKLFDYIEKRQVTRNEYDKMPIPLEDLKQMIDSTKFEGIQVKYFTSKKDIDRLKSFIIQGSNLQFQNKDFVNELVSWIRFSKKEVVKKKDGIWHASMGMPSTGRFVGNVIMKHFVSAKSEAKRWDKIINASAAFALFSVEKNDVFNWVHLGRAFQRFGLMATKLNINHAHVNMPCEELSVRNKMKLELGLENAYPLLLIRLGYSNKMPYSYRRNVDEVF
jgi:hypothetical protein